jgi:hypothetical protein
MSSTRKCVRRPCKDAAALKRAVDLVDLDDAYVSPPT